MQRNYEKEKLLVEYLISSPDVYGICSGVINPEYFSPELTPAVSFIQSYYEQYSNLPDESQVLAETGVKLSKHQMTNDKISYSTSIIEKFCKKRALIEAIQKSITVIESDDENAMESLDKPFKDALTISLNQDVGIDFFNGDIVDRIKRRSSKQTRLESGLTAFDSLVNGGLEKRSIAFFCGVSGGGKSLTLSNFSLRYVLQGWNVLYVSLELYESMIDERFMTMLSSHGAQLQRYKTDEISHLISGLKNEKIGRMFIKYMDSDTKINKIEAYMKELELRENFKPDVIVVDYLDLLSPNKTVSAENVFLKDKYATEELRNIGMKYNALILTAAQLNREARKEASELGQHHVAGGISKINTADVVLAVDISAEKKICAMKFLKSRSSSAVGKHISFNYDPNNLCIENMTKEDTKFTEQVNKTFKITTPDNKQNTIKTNDPFDDDLIASLGVFSEDYGDED